MTIFVRWKLESNNQLVLIFYFYDDYTKPNLRGMVKIITGKFMLQQPELKPIYSWAPSHIEQGLIAELLSFANRINGSSKRTEFNQIINTVVVDGSFDTEMAISDEVLLGKENGDYFVARPLTQNYVDAFKTLEKSIEPSY